MSESLPEGRYIYTPQDRAKEYKIQSRILDTGDEWKFGIISWNNCLSIKSFSQGKVSCTIVENHDISDFFRKVLFEKIWAQAEPRRPKF